MCGCKQGTCPGHCACGCSHTPPTTTEATPVSITGDDTAYIFADGNVERFTLRIPKVLTAHVTVIYDNGEIHQHAVVRGGKQDHMVIDLRDTEKETK